MTRLSDEEINVLRNDKQIPYIYLSVFHEGIRSSEDYCIPQIEKLQGEIELLTAREDEHLKDKELLNDEINKLTAKHERLVKGLKELKRFVINEGEFGQFSWTAVDADDMNLLLTEEGNV